jgi:hypothetical protein
MQSLTGKGGSFIINDKGEMVENLDDEVMAEREKQKQAKEAAELGLTVESTDTYTNMTLKTAVSAAAVDKPELDKSAAETPVETIAPAKTAKNK